MPTTAPAKPKLCKVCVQEDPSGAQAQRRVARFPGPRCASHHNDRKREIRLANHGRRVTTVYGITPEKYAELLAFQGGVCAICRVAKGNPDNVRGKRNLAVDHDHSCCSGPTSCGRCVRMLLCSACNDVLAHFRDDPLKLERAAENLRTWPSRLAGIVPTAVDPSLAPTVEKDSSTAGRPFTLRAR